ncbi:MAG: class I SAM-dependent methyltransferase [Rhizomicrobium sp.]
MGLSAETDVTSPRNASRTALGVAAHRAFHQLMDGEPKILEDRIAETLIDAGMLAQIRARDERYGSPGSRALRVRVALRSRFAETRLEKAVARGVRQCVILGAGFDTFAYRQPDWARRVRIFEVDHDATQSAKRERLKAAGIPQASNLDYVTIDFERTSLNDGLRASALDFSKPAFFSCLGVLMYLTKPAVDALFDLVASFPKGSEIAFTFVSPEGMGSPIAESAAAVGEPWLTALDADALPRDLAAKGFSAVSLLDPAETHRLYFTNRTDGLELPERTGIASAVV